MRFHALWIAVVILGIAGCGKQDQPEAQQAESPAPAAVEAEAPEAGASADEAKRAFIDHMHAHAEQLDELMFALADGDLDGAMTPAYWLSSHDSVEGIPEDWQQFVVGMRTAAAEVEEATDLDTARAAAEHISEHCQACHTAAGVENPRER
jgi:cytochrome c556